LILWFREYYFWSVSTSLKENENERKYLKICPILKIVDKDN